MNIKFQHFDKYLFTSIVFKLVKYHCKVRKKYKNSTKMVLKKYKNLKKKSTKIKNKKAFIPLASLPLPDSTNLYHTPKLHEIHTTQPLPHSLVPHQVTSLPEAAKPPHLTTDQSTMSHRNISTGTGRYSFNKIGFLSA